MSDYGKIAPVGTKVINPCIECRFYKKERSGFLWVNSETYCTHGKSNLLGYDRITGLSVFGKKEQIDFARRYICKGDNFSAAYVDGIL